MIHVIKPGFLTTIQDLGRPGFAHLGLSPGGAADSLSFRIANLLVGNDANAPRWRLLLWGRHSNLRLRRRSRSPGVVRVRHCRSMSHLKLLPELPSPSDHCRQGHEPTLQFTEAWWFLR